MDMRQRYHEPRGTARGFGQMSFSLPADLAATVDAYARARDVTLRQVVIDALRAHFGLDETDKEGGNRHA